VSISEIELDLVKTLQLVELGQEERIQETLRYLW
jgi:hypothetical protein